MICRKCANIFDDSLSECPECKTAVFAGETEEKPEKTAKKPFIVTITHDDVPEEETKSEEKVDDLKEDSIPGEEEAPEVKKVTSVKTVPKAENDKVPRKQKKTAAPKEKKVKVKDSIGDKSAATLIISVMCILACMMTVLTFVSVKSDVFKSDGEVVKTVALSSLSGEEKGELEKWFSDLSVICDSEINPATTTFGDLMGLVNPDSASGIYSVIYGAAKITANTPDPAHRFANENGDYSFYKIEEEKIDRITELFGFFANHTLNTADCYYYDGYYYFRDKDSGTAVSYITDVKDSKRIQDGSYYVECTFLYKDNLSKESLERYAIVEKVTDAENPVQWKIKRFSHEPIFDKSGVLIQKETAIPFDMKTKVIEKTAKDGTVYHKYIIEYPVFSGDTLGAATANQLYSDMINVLESEETSVQKDYRKFIKAGGVKEELPLLTYVSSRVTHNSGGYLSVLEETAEYVPASMLRILSEEGDESTADTADEPSDEPVTLPKRTVEGYNFDVASGDFITKDAVIGKDYQFISELLYRIHGGFDYSDLKEQLRLQSITDVGDEPETPEINEEIPEDENSVGMKIYESASVISEKGYMFCFVTEDGYAEDVVIPFEFADLFQIEIN